MHADVRIFLNLSVLVLNLMHMTILRHLSLSFVVRSCVLIVYLFDSCLNLCASVLQSAIQSECAKACLTFSVFSHSLHPMHDAHLEQQSSEAAI